MGAVPLRHWDANISSLQLSVLLQQHMDVVLPSMVDLVSHADSGAAAGRHPDDTISLPSGEFAIETIQINLLVITKFLI